MDKVQDYLEQSNQRMEYLFDLLDISTKASFSISDEINYRLKAFKQLQDRATGQEYLTLAAVIEEFEKLADFVDYRIMAQLSPAKKPGE